MLESVVPGLRRQGQPMRKWTQDNEDISGMKVHEAGAGNQSRVMLAGREESDVLQ